MQKPLNRNDNFLHIAILALCITPVVLSFFLFTDSKHTGFRINDLTIGFGIPCLLNSLTGYKCPACGMTRSFIYMSGINFTAAWHMNRAGVLLYVFCMLQLPYRLLHIFKPSLKIYGKLLKLEAVYLIITGIISIVDFLMQFL